MMENDLVLPFLMFLLTPVVLFIIVFIMISVDKCHYLGHIDLLPRYLPIVAVTPVAGGLVKATRIEDRHRIWICSRCKKAVKSESLDELGNVIGGQEV